MLVTFGGASEIGRPSGLVSRPFAALLVEAEAAETAETAEAAEAVEAVEAVEAAEAAEAEALVHFANGMLGLELFAN